MDTELTAQLAELLVSTFNQVVSRYFAMQWLYELYPNVPLTTLIKAHDMAITMCVNQ